MEINQELLSELKKINKNLDKINHPGKKIIYNFMDGAFRTLGSIFGTLIIISIIFFILAKVNLSEPISNWIENTLSKVRWNKIVTPDINKEIQTIQSIDTNITSP